MGPRSGPCSATPVTLRHPSPKFGTPEPNARYRETAETGGTSWTRVDRDPRVWADHQSTLSKSDPWARRGCESSPRSWRVGVAVALLRLAATDHLSQQPQRAVRTSGPLEVMATVCSAWAPREPSRLRNVQPSESV